MCDFYLRTKQLGCFSTKVSFFLFCQQSQHESFQLKWVTEKKIKEEFLFEGAAQVSDEGEVGGAAADAGEGRNKHLDHQATWTASIIRFTWIKIGARMMTSLLRDRNIIGRGSRPDHV